MNPPRPSRKEARAERALLKQVDNIEKKARLAVSLADSPIGRPRVEKNPNSAKTARVGVNPEGYIQSRMTWCVTKGDVEGFWSWGQQRQWSEQDYDSHIVVTLANLAQLTWFEILQMYADGRKRHHAQEFSTIKLEAQHRWGELEMVTDDLFRFRLTGRQRAWGYRENSHFFMVWYDPEHKIYEVGKSRT